MYYIRCKKSGNIITKPMRRTVATALFEKMRGSERSYELVKSHYDRAGNLHMVVVDTIEALA